MKNIFRVIKGTVYPFDVLVSINQTDDELGVVIDCFSAETAEDIHTAQIWYEDIPQK